MKIDAIMKECPGDAYSFSDENGVSVHDPSLFKAKDGTYYAYGTHITTAKSTDLINWETVSGGICDNNRLLYLRVKP
jgi:beta-xylosidase